MNRWSRELVEELLFREFTKGEDVSALIPPTPPSPMHVVYEFPDAAKQLFKFLDAGPSNAFLAKNVNSAPMTPMKGANQQAASSTLGGPGGYASAATGSAPSTPAPRTPLQKRPAPGASLLPHQQQQLATSANVPPSSTSAGQLGAHQHQPSLYGFGASAAPGVSATAAPKTPASKENIKPKLPGEATALAGVAATISPVPHGTGTPAAKRRRSEAPPIPAHIASDAIIKKVTQELTDLREAKASAAQQETAVLRRGNAITSRVAAQDGIDPDFIFRQTTSDVPLDAMFGHFPKAEQRLRAPRTNSGNWINDTFTPEEEQAYKKDLRFDRFGPSQALPSAFGSATDLSATAAAPAAGTF